MVFTVLKDINAAPLGWRLKSRLRGLGTKAALPQPLEALALDAVGVG
jgi:hypothetical protein